MQGFVKMLFTIMLVGLWIAPVQAVTPDTIPGTTKITAEEVFDLVEKYPDLVIVDARKKVID